MDHIKIEGGRSLRGSIPISGAKNAALPLMTLSLLTPHPVSLEGIPFLSDVQTMRHLLESLGTQSAYFHERLVLHTQNVTSCHADYDIVRKMRASILVLGPLIARCGYAKVSLPGGCALGPRLVNHHIEALSLMGTQIDIINGYICASAPASGLHSMQYTFPTSSVTGTMNVILAATAAKGEICIQNAAQEPEVCELIDCLLKMGAVIEGKGTSTLWIQGGYSLAGVTHHVLPDRIEIGTYMIAAALTQGEIMLQGGRIDLLPSVVDILRSMNITIEQHPEGIYVKASDKPSAFEVSTAPFPGFPTDLQAQFMTLATLANGLSCITETIFENRFMHVPELIRMGANITIDGPRATIVGTSALCGAPVMATDLRASVSLILAGLIAEGTTIVRRVYHLDRGYERIEEKLSACGAQITRVSAQQKPLPLEDVASGLEQYSAIPSSF